MIAAIDWLLYLRIGGYQQLKRLFRFEDPLPGIPLIASGGINTGIDIAKAIALGANIAGIARSFLLAANESTEAVIAKIMEIKTELQTTMFAIGAESIKALEQSKIQIRSS